MDILLAVVASAAILEFGVVVALLRRSARQRQELLEEFAQPITCYQCRRGVVSPRHDHPVLYKHGRRVEKYYFWGCSNPLCSFWIIADASARAIHPRWESNRPHVEAEPTPTAPLERVTAPSIRHVAEQAAVSRAQTMPPGTSVSINAPPPPSSQFMPPSSQRSGPLGR